MVSNLFAIPKAKKNNLPAPTDVRIGRGLVPPPNTIEGGLTLSFISYTPAALARALELPDTHLPLLGALVGNDYTAQSKNSSRNPQSLFFERNLTLSQRITRVSRTLRSIMTSPPSSIKRKALFKTQSQPPVGSAMDLIVHTVNALLERALPTMGSGEVDLIIECVVDSTLQYGIPPTGQDRLSDMFNITDNESVGNQYRDAYQNGLLTNKILNITSTGTYWPRLFLENPETETAGRSIGRELRVWGYAFLREAVGIPAATTEDDDEEESDDDQLVDVVESDSDNEDEDEESTNGDPLAPLRGALQRLHSNATSTTESYVSSSSRSSVTGLTRTSPPQITEYIRRGTRIAQEAVPIPPFSQLLESISIPVVDVTELLLWGSENDRMNIFLRILNSDLPSVRALPTEQLLPVLSTRWVVTALYRRSQESTSGKDKDKERWTRREANSLLSSFTWTLRDDSVSEDTAISSDNNEPLPVTDRAVQLTAQILMAIESVSHLAQILLLTKRVPDSAHLLSCSAFHARLSSQSKASTSEPRTKLLIACHDGLDSAFGEERGKKKKKGKSDAETVLPTNGKSRRGLFDLLDGGNA